MTSKRMRGLVLAVSAAGLLALSAGSANATVNAHSVRPNGALSITTVWEGPYATSAACQAEITYVKANWSNLQSAHCAYATDAPASWGGEYDPGWWMTALVEPLNY
jgi:hypothetical protein